jgi:hypothetical protein
MCALKFDPGTIAQQRLRREVHSQTMLGCECHHDWHESSSLAGQGMSLLCAAAAASG